MKTSSPAAGLFLLLMATIANGDEVYQLGPTDFASRGTVSSGGTSLGAFTAAPAPPAPDPNPDPSHPNYLAFSGAVSTTPIPLSMTFPVDFAPSHITETVTYTSSNGTTGGSTPYPVISFPFPAVGYPPGTAVPTFFSSAGEPVSIQFTPVTGGVRYNGGVGRADGPFQMTLSGTITLGTSTNGQDATSLTVAIRANNNSDLSIARIAIGQGTIATVQTITFPGIPDQTLPQTGGATPIQLDATASSGLPVVYYVVSGPATLNGNVLTPTGEGTVVVAADQYGHLNDGSTPEYAYAPQVTQSFSVVPEPSWYGGLAFLVTFGVIGYRRVARGLGDRRPKGNKVTGAC